MTKDLRGKERHSLVIWPCSTRTIHPFIGCIGGRGNKKLFARSDGMTFETVFTNLHLS